jgi:hypothetical protein
MVFPAVFREEMGSAISTVITAIIYTCNQVISARERTLDSKIKNYFEKKDVSARK